MDESWLLGQSEELNAPRCHGGICSLETQSEQMYLSCGILVYTGKGKTCLPMRGLRYRTGKWNKSILWGVLNMIKWRMRASWSFKGCGRLCHQTFFFSSPPAFWVCVLLNTRDHPFSVKKEEFYPQAPHTLSVELNSITRTFHSWSFFCLS